MTENNYDIEFISYSGLIINKKIRESLISLIILSLVFSCLSFIIIVLNCRRYNYKEKIKIVAGLNYITYNYLDEI